MAALAAGVVLVAGVGGALLVQSRLDIPAVRRAVIASVERRSGRTLQIGHLEVRLLPTPRIEADDVALGNRPGAADPQMLRIGHLRGRIGIWPLLDHVVRLDDLTLDQVTLHLRRDADGHGNWEMGPKPRRPQGPVHSKVPQARWGIELGAVRIDEARISWRDALLHHSTDLHLTTAAASGLQGERPEFSLAGVRGDAGYAVHGDVGPLRRLFGSGDRRTAWPVSAQASETIGGSAVGHGQADGSITDPMHGRGYALTVTASLSQLADLNRLFVHAGLPRMQGLELSVQVADQGHPALMALQAKAGATAVPGVRDAMLRGWSIRAASATAPLQVAAWGSWRGQALVLKGTVASLQAADELLAKRGIERNAAPVPVELALGVGKSAWRIAGVAGAGESDVRVQGFVPDVGELSAAAPDLGAVTLGARVQADHGAVFRLSDLHLASAAGDLGGTLSLSLKGRPELSGSLQSGRLDVDRLAQWGRGVRATQEAPADAGSTRAAAGTVASPDAALPWALLRVGDGDVSLRAGDLLVGGVHYRDFVTRAVLKNGRLLVDPFQASGPAGAISARMRADADTAPPTLSLWLHPVMLPAAMLMRLLGASAELRGAVEMVGQVQANGESRSALAMSSSGHVGMSMVDGAIANAALMSLVGHSAAFSAALPRAGETGIRCLAVHATFGGGEADVDTLALRTGRLSVDGHGRIGLADGALDLHLLPDASVGAAWASAPVRITGSLRDPHPALDAAAAGGRYALTIGPGGGSEMDCAAPLRVAREGVAGPAVPMASSVPAGKKRKAPKPVDILRGLGILR